MGRMLWIDKTEKLGRFLLWIVISAVLIIGFAVAPLMYVKQSSKETELRKALDESASKLAAAVKEQAEPPSQRISIESMGPLMTGLNYKTAQGLLWFTNVSPRSGIVCVKGRAHNSESKRTAGSLASCRKVDPYASIEMEVAFAGAELAHVCPNGGGCSFSVEDVPDVEPAVLAAKHTAEPAAEAP